MNELKAWLKGKCLLNAIKILLAKIAYFKIQITNAEFPWPRSKSFTPRAQLPCLPGQTQLSCRLPTKGSPAQPSLAQQWPGVEARRRWFCAHRWPRHCPAALPQGREGRSSADRCASCGFPSICEMLMAERVCPTRVGVYGCMCNRADIYR